MDIFQLHIEALKIIHAELDRLHTQIERGDGDSDTAQEQLGELQGELIRLSNALSDKECE